METRIRFVVVGLFTLIVGFAALFFVLWMQGDGTFGRRRDVHIRFAGPAPGLRVGAPVTFNGLRVGEVMHLALDPQDPDGIEARVSIDAATPVSAGTRVSLDSQGLLGAVYVSLYGGASDKPLRSIRGGPPPILSAPAGSSLAMDSHKTLEQIQGLLEDNAKPLHDTIENIQTFSAALARNANRVDGILEGLERFTGGGDKPPPIATFDLAAPRFPDLLAGAREAKLVVADPTSVVTLDTQRFLSQKPDGQLVTLNTQWSDTIPKLVQKLVLRTFEDAGYRFATSPIDGLDPDDQLLLDIRTFQFLEGKVPSARVSLGAKLAARDGNVVDARVFQSEANAASLDGGEASAAMGQAFASATHDMLVWFKETINAEK
ncbi:MAG: uncharacterized protein JWL62_1564 [Hyphomicrobiales bacterium]|nr:uncharacterized protein [Hyphomicrobiales bacterium]